MRWAIFLLFLVTSCISTRQPNDCLIQALVCKDRVERTLQLDPKFGAKILYVKIEGSPDTEHVLCIFKLKNGNIYVYDQNGTATLDRDREFPDDIAFQLYGARALEAFWQ